MNALLASAESWDPTQTELLLILVCAAGIGAVCGLVGLIVIFAKRKRHAHAQQIITAALFWGLIALGSIIYATITQLMWAREYLLELLSGYGDPNAAGPRLPWIAWGALAAGYLALLGWCAWKAGNPRPIRENSTNGNGRPKINGRRG